MTTPVRPPVLQVRLIGPRPLVDQLAATLATAARAALGPVTTYTMHTRTARRTGHVRLYLTATTKEEQHRDDRD
jgi:hypothetical protein